jgi:hypothetical protein
MLGRTVAELSKTLTFREFLEWQLYFAKEPCGPQQDDLRAGVIGATIANALRSGGDPVMPWDVMPTLEKPPAPAAPKEDLHAPEVVSQNVISLFSKLKIA